jgi:hypothetical protein
MDEDLENMNIDQIRTEAKKLEMRSVIIVTKRVMTVVG